MKIYHRSHNVKHEGSLLHFNELLCAFPRMVTNHGKKMLGFKNSVENMVFKMGFKLLKSKMNKKND